MPLEKLFILDQSRDARLERGQSSDKKQVTNKQVHGQTFIDWLNKEVN